MYSIHKKYSSAQQSFFFISLLQSNFIGNFLFYFDSSANSFDGH